MRIISTQLCYLSVTLGKQSVPWQIWCKLTEYKSVASLWLWEHKPARGWSDTNLQPLLCNGKHRRDHRRCYVNADTKYSFICLSYSALGLFILFIEFIFHTCLQLHWLVLWDLSGSYVHVILQSGLRRLDGTTKRCVFCDPFISSSYNVVFYFTSCVKMKYCSFSISCWEVYLQPLDSIMHAWHPFRISKINDLTKKCNKEQIYS